VVTRVDGEPREDKHYYHCLGAVVVSRDFPASGALQNPHRSAIVLQFAKSLGDLTISLPAWYTNGHDTTNTRVPS